jgi:outer membrane immunogenic protein
MRTLLTSAAIIAATIGSAAAADMGAGHIMPSLPAVPAAIAPATSWSGCYVGGGGGWGISKTTLTVPGVKAVADDPATLPDESAPAVPGASLDGLGADGGVLGVLGGCDLQMGQVVVGGFANYDWHQDHDVTLTLGTKSWSSGIDEQWAVGGRAGVLVGPSLVYGIAGYTEAKLDIGDHTGWVYGAGVELPLGNGFSLRGEYTYSDLEEVAYKVGPAMAPTTLLVDPDVHAVKAALTYRIGVGR